MYVHVLHIRVWSIIKKWRIKWQNKQLSFGNKAFIVPASTCWKSLPAEIYKAETEHNKAQLKLHLFTNIMASVNPVPFH